MVYIARTIEATVQQSVAEFPAVVLTGPRQSGKTTLLRHLYGDRYSYVSLEPPHIRAAALEDPVGFLQLNSAPVILDEIQYAPSLLPYIKEIIDEHRGSKGQFLMTGSQNLLMMSHVTESLAGRAAILKLLPLSFRELAGDPNRPMPWNRQTIDLKHRATLERTWPQFVRGTYPELAAEPKRGFQSWYSGYVQTYLERDIRAVRQVGDLTQFQLFLRSLAARSGQLLNLADISRDLGIALNTAKAWLSVLEATYQVIVLRPYFENVGKRLTKTPKVYFTDVGMLCHLAGLEDGLHAANGPLSGAIVETAIVSEIVKETAGRGVDPHIYFWRTSNGQEVDIVVERQGRLVPIEVKTTATPRLAMAKGLQTFRNDYREKTDDGWLVHLGADLLPLGTGVTALPFSLL